MAKIKVKVLQQNVFNKNNSGSIERCYVPRLIRYSTMSEEDIVEYCAEDSAVQKSHIVATLRSLSQCIKHLLLNGHSVEIPNLGIFSLQCSSSSEMDVSKAGVDQLLKLKVRFLPCTQLKREVENVHLELEGIYDIDRVTDTGKKVYCKVERSLAASSPAPSVQHTIAVAANPANGGTVSGGGSYASGSQVTLTASPASGYRFAGWSDGVTTATRTVTVSASMTYTASFVVNGGSGSGSDSGTIQG